MQDRCWKLFIHSSPQSRQFRQFVPILSIISVLSVVPIDCIFLVLWNETVDPEVTAEFRSERYVCPIWERFERKHDHIK